VPRPSLRRPRVLQCEACHDRPHYPLRTPGPLPATNTRLIDAQVLTATCIVRRAALSKWRQTARRRAVRTPQDLRKEGIISFIFGPVQSKQCVRASVRERCNVRPRWTRTVS